MQMKRRGVETRLVILGEAVAASRTDPALLRALACGYQWFGELASGRAVSTREIAAREGLSHSYVRHVVVFARRRVDLEAARGRAPRARMFDGRRGKPRESLASAIRQIAAFQPLSRYNYQGAVQNAGRARFHEGKAGVYRVRLSLFSE